ncbi:MAG: transcription termination factor NusA, partial [Alphaproteobacteria bacterium]
GWDIVILTEEEESERRQEEFHTRSQMFIDALELDDVLAHLLVTEGFSSVEEVAFIPVEDMLSIEGFDEELVTELRNRAHNHLADEEEKFALRRAELGISDEIAAIPGLSSAMQIVLGEAGIKALDDLADLAADELIDGEDGLLRAFDISPDEANEIIMAARAHWFEDEDAAAAEGTVDEAVDEAEESGAEA